MAPSPGVQGLSRPKISQAKPGPSSSTAKPPLSPVPPLSFWYRQRRARSIVPQLLREGKWQGSSGVEQRTHKPWVGGSNPPPATFPRWIISNRRGQTPSPHIPAVSCPKPALPSLTGPLRSEPIATFLRSETLGLCWMRACTPRSGVVAPFPVTKIWHMTVWMPS